MPEQERETETQKRGDPTPELKKLLELATKYPEIGPPVAELAFKVGKSDIGDRVVRMGLQGDSPGIEYYFVTAHAARREKRFGDARRITVEALEAFSGASEEALSDEDQSRLLHLVRLGFATLMFDAEDINADPDFVRRLAEGLSALEPRLGDDPFYRTLLAQAYWFEDRERSEEQWERAAKLGDAELTWNARGTWYKEAEQDQDRAERAYKKGLEEAPRSALLRHNLAQILVDRAERSKDDPKAAGRLLNQAEELLRAALREEAPKVRRHIHATRDRLHELRRSLPKPKGGPHKGGQKKGAGGKGGGKPPRKKRGGDRGQGFQSDGKIRLGDVLYEKLKGQDEKGQSSKG